VGFDNVAATGDGGTDSNGSSALSFDYPTHNLEAVLATSVVNLQPSVSGSVTRFTATPALPAGLQLDPTTGVISGTPTASLDNGTVTVTATGLQSSVSVVLTVTTLPGYIIDVAGDGADDDTGTDATCMSTPSGGCTLRAAFQTANRRTGKQLLVLGAQTYALGSALEAVANDIEVAGAGASVTRLHPPAVHPGYGLFTIAAAHHLWVKDLAADEFGNANGAVFNVTAGALTVDHATFTNNASGGSGGVLFINGGATAELTDSTFTSNQSFGGNGWGGVIDGEGTNTQVRVSRCYATLNSTPWGSFAHITSGTTLLLENSTLYNNTSTISGTLATPGGVYTLINDTIVGNKNTNTTPDSGTAASAGIYLYSSPCHYTVVNTIIAANTDYLGIERNCNIRDVTTSITSQGSNILSDDGRNCASYFTAAGDRLMSDPGLDLTGPGAHGGPTDTILLATGSIARDTASSAKCPGTDQRGLPRSAPCDVGAVEMP
jgi:hypothetical protein